jgi:hypothetical protein
MPVVRELACAGFFDVGHPAVYLHTHRRDLDTQLRAPRFQHGDQKIDTHLTTCTLTGVGVTVRAIHKAIIELFRGTDYPPNRGALWG